MSITNETAMAHANDPAVCCCRFEAGTVIEAANLEDPAIFPDLIDSGLLELPENYLTIGQVLGAKLKETLDALTPMTTDNVENFKADALEEELTVDAPADNVEVAEATETATSVNIGSLGIKLFIKEGKDIYLEF